MVYRLHRRTRCDVYVEIQTLENHNNIGFLSNTGPDPLKKSQSYQANMQCCAIIGPPAKRHLNGVTAFRRRADDCPLIVYLDPSSLILKKKNCRSWTLSDKIFWTRTWESCVGLATDTLGKCTLVLNGLFQGHAINVKEYPYDCR